VDRLLACDELCKYLFFDYMVSCGDFHIQVRAAGSQVQHYNCLRRLIVRLKEKLLHLTNQCFHTRRCTSCAFCCAVVTKMQNYMNDLYYPEK